MAKKKPAAGQANTQNQGETISGYFRKLFAENPGWLQERSNQALIDRWLSDHPGQTKVPENVRQNLANIKSVLRKKLRKKPGPKKGSQTAQATLAETPRKPVRGLDRLEEQIDECLSLAKYLDREHLADVISLLRKARNAVVWKLGEPADR